MMRYVCNVSAEHLKRTSDRDSLTGRNPNLNEVKNLQKSRLHFREFSVLGQTQI
jgi:hypothetical protein